MLCVVTRVRGCPPDGVLERVSRQESVSDLGPVVPIPAVTRAWRGTRPGRWERVGERWERSPTSMQILIVPQRPKVVASAYLR